MRVAVIYNKPVSSYYDVTGEQKAVLGVITEVVAARRALRELGHTVICVPLALPLETARDKLQRLQVDLAFNLFEGFCGYPGSEPDVPVILSELGIPYTGCPPGALKLALDKAKTKAVLKAGGIDTPDFQLLGSKDLSSFHLGYPCIVKPNNEDGSHGMSAESVVSDLPSLERQLTKVINLYGREKALVEEFIDGKEFNTTVMGNGEGKVLAISEIAFSLPPGMPKILTFAGKWEKESVYYLGTEVVCPADIPEYDRQRIASTAEKAFRLIGCRGYARVDMRMSNQGRLVVLEVNPNPDITPDFGAALQAEAAGLSYTRFIEKITLLALDRELP